MTRRVLGMPRVVVVVGLAGFLVVAMLAAWQASLFQPRIQRLERQLRTAKDPEDRYAAAVELGEMGEEARLAVPALIDALHDDGRYVTATMLIFPQEHYVRNAAYNALKRIGGPETIDALVTVIAHEGESDWYTSSMAARLLAEIGPEARPAAERLLDAINGCRQGEVVKLSLTALSAMRIERDSPAAVKAREVLPQFCNWGSDTGRMAARILYDLWPEDGEVLGYFVQAMLAGRTPPATGAIPINKQTVPLLVSHLGDGTREAAMVHLAAAEPDRVVPALREALQRPEALIRAGAASVLAKHGTTAAAAEPELTPLLDDENAAVRLAAAMALWQCAHQVETVLPVLAAALNSEQAQIRQTARDFVTERGAGDAWAAAVLARCVKSGHPKEQRLAALEILSRIGPPASEVSPVMLDLLRDPDADIQRAAASLCSASGRCRP
jgi:HEAT repeat protein